MTTDGRPIARALAWSASSDDALLGGQQLARAEDVARLARVLRRDQVRVRPGGAGRGQLQHPRPERGQDAPVFRHALGVEDVKVVDQRLVGRAVLRVGLRLPDADAQQETSRVLGLDAVIGARHRAASAVHTLTMPVATLRVVVASSIASACARWQAASRPARPSHTRATRTRVPAPA